MILLGILFHRANYKCMHSQLQQMTNVHYYKASNRTLQSSYEWKNFRLTLDYTHLTDPGTSCQQQGQKILDVMHQKNITCKPQDIVTENHVRVVKGTFENVVKFFGNLLSVIPLEDGHVSPVNGYVYRNTDFVLHPIINSCEDECEYLAAATYLEVEPRFNRPIKGLCLISARDIPDEISDFDSEKNKLFTTLVHEIIHALGFTNAYYKLMHPAENPNNPYENPTCSLIKTGKNFTFLTTPMAHRFAVNHYGVEEFVGDNGEKCLSGLELEDGGGLGTAYSHLEARTLLSDIMVGVSISKDGVHFMRLTDATLAFLLDTGNYKVNWSMAQPLVWGNPESIDGKPIKDFALGPPQTTFPEGYIGDAKDNTDKALFNFKGSSHINLEDRAPLFPQLCDDLTDPDIGEFCQQLPFINPKGLSYVAWDPVFDYNFLKRPDSHCQDGEAVLNGNYSKCVKYTCNEFENFTAVIPSFGKLTCNKTTIGKSIQFKDAESHSYNITCPNPERFCRTVKLHEMYFHKDPFILNVRHLDNDDKKETPETDDTTLQTPETGNTTHQTQERDNGGSVTPTHNPDDLSEGDAEKKKKIYIAVGVVCGILLVAIVVGIAVFMMHKKSGYAVPDIDEVQEP